MASKNKIIKEFRRIKAFGFIKSKRLNDTGIGKTFEDYLGVDENNLKDPDFEGFEVKSHRKTSNSYVTLFTKSPSTPKGANRFLRENYGKSEGEFNVKTLRTSIFSDKWNNFNQVYNFKIFVNRKKKSIDLFSKLNDSNEIIFVCSWSFEEIKIAFSKLHSLFFVTAESQKKRVHEYFHFTNATIFYKPSFTNFINLIDEGKIMIDLRLGIYSSGVNKGKAHDHGTAFRIKSEDLKLLYSEVFDVS
ncbi:MAG: MvaI/BcnI restriction endonuclease family protein [Bacteroidales bacterium]|nr:MvaI/BcnI restriction endonuclease family protein [Bacteroidales bacterium]